MTDKKPHELLQFFAYEHLPERFQPISKPFCELARELVALDEKEFDRLAFKMIEERRVEWDRESPNNVEATEASRKLARAEDDSRPPFYGQTETTSQQRLDWVLRLVLEAKDCAVRAVLYKTP